MTCDACDKARANPLTGYLHGDCDGCAARALALSPIFHECLRNGNRSKDYDEALSRLFKGREDQGHELVKEWRKTLRKRTAAPSAVSVE